MLWPDEIWPQENAMLAVLDGSGLFDADGRFRLEAVQETIRSRLHLVPRLRQLLYLPGPGLGRPLWVDAPAFDIREHVRVEPLAGPEDEAALLAAAEELRRLRLDRSRPLWMMWLLPGLPGRRVGMFVKLHHVLADGMASIATMAAFLDTEPSAAGVSAPLWTPPPPWPRTATWPPTTSGRTWPPWVAPYLRWYTRWPPPDGSWPPGRRCGNSSAFGRPRRPVWTGWSARTAPWQSSVPVSTRSRTSATGTTRRSTTSFSH